MTPDPYSWNTVGIGLGLLALFVGAAAFVRYLRLARQRFHALRQRAERVHSYHENMRRVQR